jgi:ATP-binding cassette subfamily F protein uup
VVGPNGAGKSTLLNMVAGVATATSGIREPGETTRIGYFTQEPLNIPEHLTMTAYLRWAASQSICEARPPQSVCQVTPSFCQGQ